MKFKLDENFGGRTQNIFREAGHDIETVREEGLSGSSDAGLFERCREEKRILVTLDLDFSDIVRFPPRESAGIVVIRLPLNPSLPFLEKLIRQFLDTLAQMSPERGLWIVEAGRIRIHQFRDED